MEPTSEQATIAGAAGAFVGQDAAGAIWEVRVSPQRLAQILAECCEGRSLQVTTHTGAYRALARRLWVLPAGNEMLVRIALHKGATA